MNFPLRPESGFIAPRQGGKLRRQVYEICKRKRVSLPAHFYDFLMSFSFLRWATGKFVGGRGGCCVFLLGGGGRVCFVFFQGGGGTESNMLKQKSTDK